MTYAESLLAMAEIILDDTCAQLRATWQRRDSNRKANVIRASLAYQAAFSAVAQARRELQMESLRRFEREARASLEMSA